MVFKTSLFFYYDVMFQGHKKPYNMEVYLKELKGIGSRTPFTTLPSKNPILGGFHQKVQNDPN